MKRCVRLISLLIAMSMLLAVPAFATEETTPRSSDYIMRTCAYIDRITSTQFEVWYEVVTLGVMNDLGAYSIRVQESMDGQSWYTVKTFYASDTPGMAIEDDIAHAGYVTCNGISGRYYRACIIFFAGNSSGEGHVSNTTETIRL